MEAFEISSSLIFFFCFAFAATAAAVVFLLLHSFFPLFLPIFCFHYDVNDDFTANRELLFFSSSFSQVGRKTKTQKMYKKEKIYTKKNNGEGEREKFRQNENTNIFKKKKGEEEQKKQKKK